jgi:hypothetical protein
MADELPAYRFDFGNWQLQGARVMNAYSRPAFFFSGAVQGRRSLHQVQFDMPITVASFEQGLAWLCYGIGRDTPMQNRPEWMDHGWALQDYLPWATARRTTR